MKIFIKTLVHQEMTEVWKKFEKPLLEKLTPPFPPVKILRFDGSQKGNEVHLELNFIFFRQLWISQITENQENLSEIYFIDEGIKLPFFLKSWKHKHQLLKQNNQTWIIDDIEFQTPFWVMNFVMYVPMYLQFWYRKPIYKQFFR